MASADIYATAKSNLRDNVKTLIGIFGGIAGLLLAGTPFSGYGALSAFSGRWWVASIGLLLAVVFVGLSVWLLLRLLQPDLVYQSALRQNVDLNRFDKSDRDEIDALRKEFLAHREDMLPSGAKGLDDLEALADTAYGRWQTALASVPVPGAPAGAVQAASQPEAERKAYEDLNDSLTTINQWAAYVRLRYRIIRGCNKAFLLGLAALCAIGVFSWAVGQRNEEGDKKEAAQQAHVIVLGGTAPTPAQPGAAPLPLLNAILFETGRSNLSAEGMTETAKARDFLRTHPDTGVLAFAYTDTRGNAKLNRALANRRARVVKDALMTEGGISGSRIFVAELPETDLPLLTGRAVDSEKNRSVQLVLLPLPPRGR
ncbi:MAG: OmpA family protein [Ramlibacter sp.]|nr:OmpA family protein [Ramlibacter sp.]